jgi:stage II sporulation protein D
LPKPSIQRLPVRVRLIKSTKRVVIRGTQTLKVTTVGGRSVSHGQREVELRAGRGGIVVGKKSTKARELRITAATPVTLVSRKIRCYRRDKEAPGVYRGILRVFLHGGQLRVVNEVDIEHYLYGVVPAEVPSSWPPEALKALAIAARTYALYQAKHRSDWTYDLVDSDGDQVYRGTRCETKRTNRAVDATRGMLLIHARRPILAMYTANTGWHSASASHVFGTKLPYLTGVKDPYSPTQPMGRWKRTHQAKEIQQKLRKIGLRFGTIKNILPAAVTPSGRITRIKLVSSRGTKILRARSTIRRALDLPEVLLNITRRKQTYVFEGGGFGHGVGLSQWGAKDMASKGKSARDILHFYYRNVRVERLW